MINIYWNRAEDNVNHLFIHLNLCIALAMGLIVFIAGIEQATENEVTTTVILLLMLLIMKLMIIRLPASL